MGEQIKRNKKQNNRHAFGNGKIGKKMLRKQAADERAKRLPVAGKD
jgi:hypothetical protein